MHEYNGELERVMTPTALSRRYHISRYNVYYWMKKLNLGFKEGRFWYLTHDHQQTILELARDRYSDRRVGTNPKAYVERQNATASEERILADLKVDVFKAEKIQLLLDYRRAQVVLRLMETISDYKDTYGELPDYERVMLIFASLLERKFVGQLAIARGFPLYLFVVPEDPEAFTIVFEVTKRIFYLDVYAEIYRKHPDLKLDTKYLQLHRSD